MGRAWCVAGAAAAMVLVGARACAEDAFEGRYLQNRPCRGDRTDPPSLRVTITPQQITYAGGTCAIKTRRGEGSRLIFGVACRFRSGITMGSDIVFTRQRGGVWHMIQGDGDFEADIYRCPD
ncbi:hypothetical protein GGQ91_004161 [Methylobacterium fujisawaense]|uniref:Uncharacterized protein n=1 Tax=Methylobacterium fujisawaense TaxID=107400 RepID=A0ABR6DF82_9HYPH|nr:hypothetical protein [Methylobacterium fujisawaense]MBA9064755.1 hypothetical protein [Methylobacterium fujisawaense]